VSKKKGGGDTMSNRNVKIVCIVQARMNSERLPGKVIRPILGIPSVVITLKRLSLCRYIDELILATTDRRDDDILCETVAGAGYKVFRGDEADVQKRYYDCANSLCQNGQAPGAILRVTGDCPLIEPVLADSLLTHYLLDENGYDYMRVDVPETFPRGLDAEVLSYETLKRSYDLVHPERSERHLGMEIHPGKSEVHPGMEVHLGKSEVHPGMPEEDTATVAKAAAVVTQTADAATETADTTTQTADAAKTVVTTQNAISMFKEHVTYYIYNHPETFRVGFYKGGGLFNRDYRLCVDTEEDFLLVNTIFEHFGSIYPSAADVIRYLDANPEVANINCGISQRF
jgi:spore coat polysaccharide biosynthesis protein SpsF (cytidylyltransferase family)